MPRKATYPEWVTRHLTTGIYVNKVGGCYYLYRAHSEHQPGVSHPVRVCDEYLGRVTEADGLIRSKGSVRDVVIFDFGIPYIIYQKTSRILDGLSKSYENGQTVYVCAILDYLFSFHTQDLYKESWLSMVFPKLNIPAPEDSSFTTAVERGQRMISTEMKKTFGEDLPLILAYFRTVVLVRTHGKLYCPKLSDEAARLADKYHVEMKVEEHNEDQ